MPTTSSSPRTVLVTGGTGFLGGWVIVALLREGYRVRTTVRSLSREAGLRAQIAGEIDPGDRLTVHVADLLSDDGWDAATQGSDHVIHTASPMPVGEFKGQDIVTPARKGTVRVLEAATRAGVKRVVLTSSGVAALPPLGRQAVMDETFWTTRPDRPAFQYPRAKTLAEQDAWAFVKSREDAPELTAILPGFIQGPVLGEDFSGSVDLIAQMLSGKMPAAPRIGFRIVDVRDLAALHVRALTAPEAAGERFLAMGDFLWLSDIAVLLSSGLGERAAKVSTRTIPDWLVHLLAPVSPDMAALKPDLGVKPAVDVSKVERRLGWATRPAERSVLDAAESLIQRRLVQLA